MGCTWASLLRHRYIANIAKPIPPAADNIANLFLSRATHSGSGGNRQFRLRLDILEFIVAIGEDGFDVTSIGRTGW